MTTHGTPTPESSSAHSRSAMQEALDVEIARLEVSAVKADLVGAGAAAAASLIALLATGSKAAPVVLGCSGLAAAYLLLALRLLSRGRGVRVFQWLNPAVEISAPSVILAATAWQVSADAALTSSPAVMAYGIPMAICVLRLRGGLPVFVGLVGAVQYALVAHFILLPGLSEALRAGGSVRAPMVYANSVVILATGIVAGLVSVALRRAVGAAHHEVRVHDLFGKYQLGDVIAEGGMGVVMRATYCPEGGFRRNVAVKRIHPHLARNLRFVEAFRNEAALCARLNHPNIVQVLDFGRVDDTYFFAMEYVDGMSLSDVLKSCAQTGRVLPLDVVAHLAHGICSGLHHAQEVATDVDGMPLRVVHRDLTPSNVLLARSGQVKIADFGIARALGATDGTMTATVQGKLAYMAPEQARAQKLDGRCDLFALGAVLWEMLAGRHLFRRGSDSATLLAVLEDAVPPPSTLRAGLPPVWDSVVMRALERDPARRFQQAGELLAALDELVAQHPLAPGGLARFLVGVPAPVPTEPAAMRFLPPGGTLADDGAAA